MGPSGLYHVDWVSARGALLPYDTEMVLLLQGRPLGCVRFSEWMGLEFDGERNGVPGRAERQSRGGVTGD